MAILETITSIVVVSDDFTLTSSYSGEVNPNITYEALFIVKDEDTNLLEGVEITIGSETKTTDINGEATFDLIRETHEAEISKTGYTTQTDIFTIIDINVTRNITLIDIGSFGDSYDDSYDK